MEPVQDLPRRLAFLRKLVPLATASSPEGALNHDSLVYLASFALGRATNSFQAIGAVKTLGASSAQVARVIDLLEELGQSLFDPGAFPAAVSQHLRVQVAHHAKFPATPPPSDPLQSERLREYEEAARQAQARARADEEIDQRVAALLSVEVGKRENEWGLYREDTGEYFSPTSSPGIVAGLIEQYKLNVFFTAMGLVVSAECRYGQVIVTQDDHHGSLSHAVCLAALRMARAVK